MHNIIFKRYINLSDVKNRDAVRVSTGVLDCEQLGENQGFYIHVTNSQDIK